MRTASHALAYDAGPAWSADIDGGNRIVVPFLRGEGVARLDGVVISHADEPAPSNVTATFRVSVGDGDLSLVNMPADVTVQATGPSGAAVGFVMPSSTDEDGSSPSVTCDHLSGSLFPLGTTTVTCTATDPDDTPSTVSATFKVTVIDTDLGLEGVSQDITVSATGPSGAIVTYVAPTGVDEDGEDLVVTCDHASGATYPIGTTTVTCSVSDEDDTPSTRRASFNITVNDTDLALTNVPADITAVATGASGAAVSFTPPTVIDEDADKPAVTCNRDSGSMFAVGTTTVTCSASDPDDSPSTVTASFHVTVIPDVRLAITVSPVTATAHSTVTTTVAATNIGNATEKVTITYSVAYVDASGAMSIVTSDKAQVTVSPGQTANRTFSFAVKNTTAKGAYVVTVTASDVTACRTPSLFTYWKLRRHLTPRYPRLDRQTVKSVGLARPRQYRSKPVSLGVAVWTWSAARQTRARPATHRPAGGGREFDPSAMGWPAPVSAA